MNDDSIYSYYSDDDLYLRSREYKDMMYRKDFEYQKWLAQVKMEMDRKIILDDRAIATGMAIQSQKTVELSTEQEIYLRKINLWLDQRIMAHPNYHPNDKGKDVFIEDAKVTVKRSTINRILKSGEYYEGEKEYLNKLGKVYVVLKREAAKRDTDYDGNVY